MSAAVDPLLRVSHLHTQFSTEAGLVRAVEDVSFTLDAGELLAVVGESGSGKSVTSLSIMGLIADPPGRVAGGEILFRTRAGPVVDLARLPARALRKLRGRDLAMIFQEPMTSLNPVFSIGDQIAEAAVLHLGMARDAARAARARDARAGRDSGRAAAPRRVSASAVGRHATAGDDRDRARLRSLAADRRRADDGPRRHHPGADPGAARQAAARHRHGGPLHHPQPRRRRRDRRPGRRHVCRPGGRGEPTCELALQGAAASVHARPARLPAATRARQHRAPGAVDASTRSPARWRARSTRCPAAPSRRAAPWRCPNARRRCRRSPTSPRAGARAACAGARCERADAACPGAEEVLRPARPAGARGRRRQLRHRAGRGRSAWSANRDRARARSVAPC